MPSAPLSASQVAALNAPGVHRVDRGLYLQIRDNGARSWLLRFQLNGRARAMGLGPLHLVPLSSARSRAIIAQRQLLDGIDPIEARRAARESQKVEPTVPTFSACAEQYIEAHEAEWSNAKHAWQWSRSLELYAYPTIGHLPVDTITVNHIAELLTPIWTTKSETAGRVRNRIERVLAWAEARGHRQGMNPATWKGPLGHILPALSRVQKIVHHEAVPYADVPTLYEAICCRDGNSAAALRFVLLTASRSGEVRGMCWQEIDRKTKTWTVPADRMKARKEHKVPLSDEALAVLPAKDGAPAAFVFPGARAKKPLSDMSLIKVMRSIRGDGSTVHGLRSSFRDWAAEKTDTPREVMEAALAHQIGTEVERAYLRSDLFDKRRDLMVTWATFCSGGKVTK